MWHLEEQRLKAVPPTKMDMLRLMYPGRGYAVELYFDTGRGAAYSVFEGEGRFRGWKVNVEAPFKRTAIGFDTIDDIIDLFVRPDGSWYWTDRDELDYWVKVGGYREEDRERFMARGFAAEALIEARQAPFDDEWTGWEPPVGFGRPGVPEGWQFIEGADITLSTGRRYDAWRPGYEVQAVIEGWYRTLDRFHNDPSLRRFRPERRGR